MEGNVRADWALELVRGQRHSLLNALQVISGWLQLNRPELAMEQLTQLVNRLTAEMEATRGLAPEVALHLLAVMIEAELIGVTLRWQIDSSAVPAPEAWDEVCAALRTCGSGELTLRIDAAGHVGVHNTPDRSEA